MQMNVKFVRCSGIALDDSCRRCFFRRRAGDDEAEKRHSQPERSDGEMVRQKSETRETVRREIAQPIR